MPTVAPKLGCGQHSFAHRTTWTPDSIVSHRKAEAWIIPVFLLWPKHRLGHCEDYTYVISKIVFIGSKYLEILIFSSMLQTKSLVSSQDMCTDMDENLHTLQMNLFYKLNLIFLRYFDPIRRYVEKKWILSGWWTDLGLNKITERFMVELPVQPLSALVDQHYMFQRSASY